MWAFLWIMMVLSAVGLGLQVALLLRLKRKHGEVWKRLGEPMTFWHFGPKQQKAVHGFYKSAEYRDLDDVLLTRLVITWKIFGVVYMTAMVIYVTLFTYEFFWAPPG